jgi:hypothetical protein
MTDYPPLDVEQAIDYAKEWRNLIKPFGNGEVLLRAFNIPSSDLINLYDYLNENSELITGFRAYLGVIHTSHPDSYTAKIMLVPVGSSGDILTDNYGGPQVYDFTAPCPSQCDIHSPMYDETNPR